MVPDTVKDDIQAIRDELTGGTLDVNIASGGAGDGAILDGASPSIKATVKDLTNANPLITVSVSTRGILPLIRAGYTGSMLGLIQPSPYKIPQPLQVGTL